MKSLLALEEKRRATESQLNKREKKGVVKKARVKYRKKGYGMQIKSIIIIRE